MHKHLYKTLCYDVRLRSMKLIWICLNIYNMSGFAIVIILNLKSYSEDKGHSYSSFPYEAYKNLFQNIYHSCAVLASRAGLRGAKILNEGEDIVCVCVCVCVCTCGSSQTLPHHPPPLAQRAASRPNSIVLIKLMSITSQTPADQLQPLFNT